MGLLALTALLAGACTSDIGTTADRITALYGDDVRVGDCAMTRETARDAAQELFPLSTVVEVEEADLDGIPAWEIELETENGGDAEVELFVATCGLYEVESNDADVSFVPGELVATSLADAIAVASAERDGPVVEWELERDEDHGGVWVFELRFEDDVDVTVSAVTGQVLYTDRGDHDDDVEIRREDEDKTVTKSERKPESK
ncbi:MAG: PepSY domain-containing protein [Sandaracinaceae bacterium]